MDPAYAGMILVALPLWNMTRSGPRVCGDDPNYGIEIEEKNMWTPRMRG